MTVDKLDWGPPALQEWADAITAAINANQPVAGTNIFLVESSSGTAVNLGEQPDEGD